MNGLSREDAKTKSLIIGLGVVVLVGFVLLSAVVVANVVWWATG